MQHDPAKDARAARAMFEAIDDARLAREDAKVRRWRKRAQSVAAGQAAIETYAPDADLRLFQEQSDALAGLLYDLGVWASEVGLAAPYKAILRERVDAWDGDKGAELVPFGHTVAGVIASGWADNGDAD